MPHSYYMLTVEPGTFNDNIRYALSTHAPDKQTIVFCRTAEHAYNVSDNLMRSGIPADPLTASMKKGLREQVLQSYADRTTRVLCAASLFSLALSPKPTGTECIVFACCTTSQLRHSNELAALDTQDGIIIDMAGRFMQFGIE